MNKRININRHKKPSSNEGFFDTINDKPSKSSHSGHDNRGGYTRQTFMIKKATLDKLKDFVHTKRLTEDYDYSQKQALEEGLRLLFETLDEIQTRPAGKK